MTRVINGKENTLFQNNDVQCRFPIEDDSGELAEHAAQRDILEDLEEVFSQST